MSAQRFSYKPALLRQARRYELDQGVLREIGEDGPLWSLPLSEVTKAAFVNQNVKRIRAIRLDLFQGETRRRLAMDLPEAGWRADPDARAYIEMVRALMLALDGARPGLGVIFGEYGKARLVMAAIGLLSALAGIAIFALALIAGVSGDRLIAGAVPMVMMVALGAVLMKMYNPFTAPPSIPPRQIEQGLGARMSSAQPSP